MEALFLVSEIAARLRCSLSNVYNLIAAGKLRCYRVGRGRGAIRVSERHIQEYLDSSEGDQIEVEKYPHLR